VTAIDSVRFQRASDQSLLVYFGEQITVAAHRRVLKLLRLLQLEPIAGIRNLHPAYCSLLVKFDALQTSHEAMEAALRTYIARLEDFPLPNPRKIEIPVCYGDECSPDLEEIAKLRRITPEEAIDLHTSATYTVYFLGFAPGFAYLGDLPEALAIPRLDTPRRKVPAGSVAIAGRQTAVYPFSTPGGWRLIGRTPIAMFRPELARQTQPKALHDMSLLSIGDHVRFTRISREQFAALHRQ